MVASNIFQGSEMAGGHSQWCLLFLFVRCTQQRAVSGDKDFSLHPGPELGPILWAVENGMRDVPPPCKLKGRSVSEGELASSA